MRDIELAELMTKHTEQVSGQIQVLLHGLGMRTQGAILADLVSLWLAGQFDISEVGRGGPLTAQHRERTLAEWVELVCALVPESEKQIMQKITPEGRA